MDWIVEITGDMIERAEAYERSVLAHGITDEGDYSQLGVEHQWYKGHLGELAFVQLLERDHKRY